MTGNASGRLQRWLIEELNRRNLSARQASLGAGLTAGGISHYLFGNRPNPAACRKLAEYFEVPPDYVLYLAGHINAPEDYDLFLKRIEPLIRGLSEERRRLLYQMVRAMAEESRAEQQSETDNRG